MAIFNFGELKQKLAEATEVIADKSAGLYKKAEEKTRITAKITKLNAEITRDKGAARRLYAELGKKYYELHKCDAEEALAAVCGELTAVLESIEAKQAEIADIKAAPAEECDCCECDDDIEVEIVEEPVEEAEEECCCGCGCTEEKAEETEE